MAEVVVEATEEASIMMITLLMLEAVDVAAVARELASNAVKKVTFLVNVPRMVEIQEVGEAVELVSNVERKAIYHATAPKEAVVAAVVPVHAITVEKRAICQEIVLSQEMRTVEEEVVAVVEAEATLSLQASQEMMISQLMKQQVGEAGKVTTMQMQAGVHPIIILIGILPQMSLRRTIQLEVGMIQDQFQLQLVTIT